MRKDYALLTYTKSKSNNSHISQGQTMILNISHLIQKSECPV